MIEPRPSLILNINDHDGIRYGVSHTLRRAGFAVTEAATGSDALRLARETEPQLIILDINLPDINGYELCRRLKTDPPTATIPILHLSATYTKSEDRVYGLENGADGYLVQPVEPDELVAMVRALLHLRQAEESQRHHELLAQRVLQAMPDAIVMVDCHGRIVHINDQALRLFGYTQDELCGEPVEMLLPERLRQEHQAHRLAYSTRPWRRPMGLGLDLVGRHKEGHEIPVEVMLSPVTVASDDFVIASIRDIRDRRQSEATLHARLRQLETVRTVTAEITRVLDLTELLNLIIQRTVEIIEPATSGCIRLWDATSQTLVPQALFNRGEWERDTRFRLGEGLAGTVALHRQGMLVHDYPHSPYAHPLIMQHLAPPTVLAEPLMYRDRLVGIILVDGERPRCFTTEHQELLALFAAQAAIAIENAHLFEVTQRHQREAEQLARAGRLFLRSFDPDEVGQHIVDSIRQLYRTQAAVLYRLESASAPLKVMALSGEVGNPELRVGTTLPSHVGAVGLAMREACPIVSRDIFDDPRITFPPEARALFASAPRSILAVPLVVQGRVIGGLAIGAQVGRQFTPEEIRLAESFADQAALALERTRLYADARRTGDFLQSIVENSPDGIVVTDVEGYTTYVSPSAERMVGYSADQWFGRHMADVLRGGMAEAQALRQRLQAEDVIQDYETAMRTAGGQSIEVSLSMSMLRNHDSVTTGTLYILKDISVRKQLASQLRQAQKMQAIGTLAGGIAHDFNNILTAIQGYSEMTLDDVPQGSLARGNLQEVLIACQRAKELVRQILSFSRQTDQERKPVELQTVLKEALQLLRATLPATMTMQQHLEAGTVIADSTQLHQIILNLCTNAEHAMRDTGGELDIRLEAVEVDPALASTHPDLRPGPYMRLYVRDTGTGMSPDILERIFEPFFTTKEVGQGTGMGLAMVHGLVMEHGGAITVDSTLGEGTTITVYLPRVETQVPPAADIPEVMPHGQECILVVEDEVNLAQLIRQMLMRQGYEVVMRTSSVDALEAFRANPQRFDLVITDQTMPNLTGLDLAAELRKIRLDIPIILCTGFSHTITEASAREMGINAFLMKPYGANDLARVIREVLTP